MPPQITCPHCGSTINLENRKEVDFEKIIYALNNSPKTFTELLEITSLPRKTLSLRLKDLCNSGSIVKDGGYRLGTSLKPNRKIFTTKSEGNGKMNGKTFHVGKNVQWIPVALMLCLLVLAFGSALRLSPPPSAPNPPMASFFYAPSTITTGKLLTFDASESSASLNYISSYSWSFGDGTSATGKIVTHAYNQEGQYAVTLRVVDSLGLTSTKVQTINVYALTQPKISFAISPDNTIGGWENQYVVNKPLTFDASAFNQASGYASVNLWNFGDGTTATGTIVSHMYESPGIYSVTLTVTNLNGVAQPITKLITIQSTEVYIYIDPLPANYQIGDVFTLNIKISNVANLFAWQTGMTFNPAVLECITATAPSNVAPNATTATTALTEGDFLKQGGNTIWFPGTVENGVIVAHSGTLLNPATPVSGSGTLATVTFQVIGSGDLNIHLVDVFLIGGDGSEIPVYVAT